MAKISIILWILASTLVLNCVLGCTHTATGKDAIINGRIVYRESGSPAAAAEVVLLKGNYNLNPLKLPRFVPIAHVMTKMDGSFSFAVPNGRGFIIEVNESPEHWVSNRVPVDMKKLRNDGMLVLEIKVGPSQGTSF